MKDRFFAQVDRVADGCHRWTGAKSAKGYGRFFLNGKSRIASRVAWEISTGTPPGQLLVLHRCDNPACVNPDHLFLGTNEDNLKDMAAKKRSIAGESHHRAKLTASDIVEIRSSKLRTCDLAKLYGISPQQMGAIRNGKAWNSVEVQQ